MLTTESKYINFVPFSGLFNWSVQYLSETRISFNANYPMVRIGEFLKRNKTAVAIEDDKFYKRATIKVRNGGVFLRDNEIGTKIGTKSQFRLKKGQFLLSKIDARNGAFGVVSEELDGGVITGNFWTFDVDYAMVNPHYLSLVVTTPEFILFCEQASNGTTNRHYLQEPLFLEIKIPLPTIEEQDELVRAYNERINNASQQEAQATKLELEIERYLLDVLGVKISNEDKQHRLLNLFSYSDISDRWDLLATENNVFEALKYGKFKSIEIGKAYDFISRTWKPNINVGQSFKYIELGAVDALNGIKESVEVSIEKAPSRATQFVQTGDMIIGTTRPYLKKFAIVTTHFNNNVCSSGFQIINSNSNNLAFLHEFLKSEAGIQQFKFYMTGALYPAITGKDLRRIKIPLPPLEIQNEIVAHITELKDQIKSLKANAEGNRTSALTEFEQHIFN